MLTLLFLLNCPGALRLAAAPTAAGSWCADLPQALIVSSGKLGDAGCKHAWLWVPQRLA